ncbi:MAG: hypothetical protein IM600_10915 [Bacteroidetes bacterium]|nr:hypothetical protein [Bacteroidota bacterium]MCA6443929.1 hypothetical protein [Bacteroidota bacterium]
MLFCGLSILKRQAGKQFDVYLCEGDMVVIQTKNNSTIDVMDIKEMLSLIDLFNLESKSKLLSIAGAFSELTSEAQKFMRTEEANVNRHIAEAIVVNSLAQRIIGNMYLKIASQNRPSKLFTVATKAIEWLKAY